jgi:hypothetical protein
MKFIQYLIKLYFIIILVLFFTIQVHSLNNLTMQKILESIERSFSDIIPFLPFNSNNPNMWDFLLKSIGSVFIGLIFISLRRNFERKFSH